MESNQTILEDIYKPTDDIVERKIGDSTCLYSPSKGLIMSLNETALYIFKSCDKKNSVNHILEELAKTYKNVSKEILCKDLLGIITEMSEKGILIKV
jgi:hypothetical protein